MAIWEAHTCLPLNPDASFAPLLTYRECGVRYVSINIGMDMTPLDQVMTVIAGFRATIAAHPQELVLATTVQALAQNSAQGLAPWWPAPIPADGQRWWRENRRSRSSPGPAVSCPCRY